MKKKRSAAFWGAILSILLFTGVLFVSLFYSKSMDSIGALDEKGDMAFAGKEYGAAINYWMRAAEKSEDQERFYLKIGEAFLKSSNLDQAEVYLEKALEKSPSSPVIQKQVIRISLLKGNADRVETLLSQMARHSEKDPEFHSLSGDYFMLHDDFEQAERSYRTALEYDSRAVRPYLKLAACLMELKKTGEAGKLISGIQNRIENPSDLMLLADYLMLRKSYDKAEKFMLRAIEGEPENLSFKTHLCRLYRTAGIIEKAEDYLHTLVSQYPDRPEFKLILADISLSRLDMDSAERWMTELEKIKDVKLSSPGYHVLMGKFWLFQQRYSHAVSYLKNALELNYNLVSAHYLLGVAYFAGGQTKLAEKELIQALTVAPNHVDALMAMAGLYYKKKDYPLARQYVDRIVSLDPSNSRAWKLQGLCFIEEGKYKPASQALAKAWHLDGHSSSLFFLGKAFEGMGLKDAADEAYVSVLKASPDMVEALFQYVMFKADTGKKEEAFDLIDRRIRDGESDSGVYYIGAQLSLSVEDYERCQAYLERGMAIAPVSGAFFLLMADLQRARGNDQGVEDALAACTREIPRFLDGWLTLAGYYMEKQGTAQALDTLEKAVKLFPDDPNIMGNLAWLLLETETDIDRAFELARDAHDRLPGQAWLMDTLGWAYYHKKIYSQAEWLLEQAEERAPDAGLVGYHQGMVLYRRGKLADARDKLESALASEDLGAADRESAREILIGLKDNSGKKAFENGNILDPDTGSGFDITEMPALPEDDEDILQPDWSKLNSN